MDAEQLRDQIRLAFPRVHFCGAITSCNCDECADIREALRHKRWDEVTATFIDSTCSPVLLTPEAFGAFLPAYLFRALDNLSPHSVVTELTVYSLCPNDQRDDDGQMHEGQVSDLLRKTDLMTLAQIQVVRTFLMFVQDNSPDGRYWKPFIEGALEKVWR